MFFFFTYKNIIIFDENVQCSSEPLEWARYSVKRRIVWITEYNGGDEGVYFRATAMSESRPGTNWRRFEKTPSVQHC